MKLVQISRFIEKNIIELVFGGVILFTSLVCASVVISPNWNIGSNRILLEYLGILAFWISIYILLKGVHKLSQKYFSNELIAEYKVLQRIKPRLVGFWILVGSAGMMLLELSIIRYSGNTLPVFAYFKNILLLSAFLGLGIGFAHKKKLLIPISLIVPLFCLQLILLKGISHSFLGILLFNPVSESITFGINTLTTHDVLPRLLVFGFIGVVFVLNATIFIPLGQLIIILMNRLTNLTAYSFNLAGSLIGILVFTLLAFIWSPPIVWFGLGFLMLLPFYVRSRLSLLVNSSSLLLLLLALFLPTSTSHQDIFSPYQLLSIKQTPGEPTVVGTNQTYFQRMWPLKGVDKNVQVEANRNYFHYDLPYVVNPEAQRILIVGAGTGNDVSAALNNTQAQIDAVEIDPVIYEIGKELHPDQPYSSDRVTVYIDDARNYIRHTDKKYDLIVFGLLDSHTLLSGKNGGVRLDSYVYTVESFQEAAQILTDEGALYLAFAGMNQKLWQKVDLMLRQAVPEQPPYMFRINYDTSHAFITGKNLKLENLQLPPGIEPFDSGLEPDNPQIDVSTDNWPFFYMPTKSYPITYVYLILFLCVLILLFAKDFISIHPRSFSGIGFFLGAGFMLIETKAIAELALFHGSVWQVVAIVISFILCLALAANWLVSKQIKINMSFLFLGLFLSILLGYWLSLNNSPLDKWLMSLLVTLPVFFSGIIFSKALQASAKANQLLASNILGAMVGGMLEYNSMYFGIRSLYWLALVLYTLALLSWLTWDRRS